MYNVPWPKSLALINAPVLGWTSLMPSVGGGNEDSTTMMFSCCVIWQWLLESNKFKISKRISLDFLMWKTTSVENVLKMRQKKN